VVAGEGRIDHQSLAGKIVGEIAARAASAGVPLHIVVGRDQLDSRSREQLGPASIREATTLEAIAEAGSRICRQARARVTVAPTAAPPQPDVEIRGHAAAAG
jgi:glycerate kinase